MLVRNRAGAESDRIRPGPECRNAPSLSLCPGDRRRDRHPGRMTEAQLTKTRAVIADDEPLARQRLRMLLAEEAWIDLVAECVDAPAAIAAIEKFRPSLVFLDVQMPGGSGFDVIETVGADRMPFVIFVTAFDRYALRGFDVHALDYLLKPLDRERFREALARARERIDRRTEGDLEQRLLALVKDLKPGP